MLLGRFQGLSSLIMDERMMRSAKWIKLHGVSIWIQQVLPRNMMRSAGEVFVGQIPEYKSKSRSENNQDLLSRDQPYTLVPIDTPVLGWIPNSDSIDAHWKQDANQHEVDESTEAERHRTSHIAQRGQETYKRLVLSA